MKKIFSEGKTYVSMVAEKRSETIFGIECSGLIRGIASISDIRGQKV